MAILLTNNGVPVANAEVAAFIDGECRGTSFANVDEEQSLYYLLIAGEGSGQPMELRVYLDGSTLKVRNDLTYISDGNIGTPWEPFVVDIKNAVGISSVEDVDDGSAAWYTLQGICLGTDKPTRPGVYFSSTAKDRLAGKNGKKLVIKR
jgi:hypothetical protein